MVLFAVIPFSLFGIFYFGSERDKWEEEALGEYAQMLAGGTESLDRAVQDMESKALYVSNNSDIRAAMGKVNRMSLVHELDFVKVLQDTVGSITAENDALTVRWYPYLSVKNYGSYCYTLDLLLDEFEQGDPAMEHILGMEGGEMCTLARTIRREVNNAGPSEERICVYVKMGYLNGSECILEMTMPVDRMVNMNSTGLPEGSIYGGRLLYGDEAQTILMAGHTAGGQELLEQYWRSGVCPGYYARSYAIDSLSGGELVGLFPEHYVNEVLREKVVQFCFIIVLLMGVILACSYGAASLLTARITRTIERMNGELSTFLAEPSARVISESDFVGIERRISRLIQNTREYSVRLEQQKAEMNRMELELLQMRFNPHFLYNTLASMRYQVRDQVIRKSIDSLIHYYRIVLSKGHLLIQIEEEIAMIREYLDLEIFAYRLEKVSYSFEIDREVKGCTIIKHLLQPIVENALEHGVRANEQRGCIRISARTEGADIVFEIEDNGAGMTREQIAEALKEPAGGSAGGGYGIYNVQQRIESHYGTGYGIAFYSHPGQGTRAVIRIPRRTEKG